MSMGKTQHRATLTLAWCSWLVAWGGTTAIVFELVPRHLSMIVILAIGVGVSASLSLSRHGLAKTITEVFVTGMKISMTTHLSADQRIRALDDYAQSLPGELETEDPTITRP